MNKKLIKSNKLGQKYILAISFTAMAVLLLVFRYFRSDLTTELFHENEAKLKDLAKLELNIKNSSGIGSHIDTLVKNNEILKAGALIPSELAKNIQPFQRLETEVGFKLIDVKQHPLPTEVKIVEKGLYVYIPFTVTIDANYIQLVHFLKKLERGQTLNRVTSLTLDQFDKGTQTITINLDMLGLRP